jgi:hypothetical protein
VLQLQQDIDLERKDQEAREFMELAYDRDQALRMVCVGCELCLIYVACCRFIVWKWKDIFL